MKFFLTIFAILLCANGFAQATSILADNEIAPSIKYVGSSRNSSSSQAVIVDNSTLVHTAQFSSLDGTGNMLDIEKLDEQVEYVFQRISRALNSANSRVDQIIKLNVYLKNVDLLPKLQPLLRKKFTSGKYPAITYAFGDLTGPHALVSMDAVAVSKSPLDGKVHLIGPFNPKNQAEAAFLPIGPVVYISGQAAKGGLQEATKGTLEQLHETLISLGLTKQNIVQIKCFLSPMSSLNIVEEEFSKYFVGEKIPPLVFVDWISSDPVIEIEMIASSTAGSLKNDQIEYITPPGMKSSPVYSKVTRLNFGKKVYLSGISTAGSGNIDSEVNKIFLSMADVLKASGSDFRSLLKATYYVSDDRYSKSLGDLRTKYFDPKRPPAASKAMLKGIGLNGAGISVDMIGTIKENRE